MEKVIKIGDKDVRLNNNVGWTMEYRDQFGKDIVPALLPVLASAIESAAAIMADKTDLSISEMATSLEGRALDIMLPLFQIEFVDVVIDVTWAMAKAADESIAPPKQWVRQFDSFPLDVVVPEIFSLAMKGFVSSKNLERLKSLRINLQPLTSTISSLQVSNEA